MKKHQNDTLTGIGTTLKQLRAKANVTQQELARRSGVGLRFVREVEQGKQTVRVDKVNQVLALFGYHLEAVKNHETSA